MEIPELDAAIGASREEKPAIQVIRGQTVDSRGVRSVIGMSCSGPSHAGARRRGCASKIATLKIDVQSGIEGVDQMCRVGLRESYVRVEPGSPPIDLGADRSFEVWRGCVVDHTDRRAEMNAGRASYFPILHQHYAADANFYDGYESDWWAIWHLK